MTADVPLCDHQCVGVVIPDCEDTYWLLDRGKPPPGWAGVGGHLDDHGSPEAAARVETKQEMGLTVVSLIPVFEEWFPNWCRRRPQPRKLGHDWHIFIAEWEGEPTPSPEKHAACVVCPEVTSSRWLSGRPLTPWAT